MAVANLESEYTLVNDISNTSRERADFDWGSGTTYQPGDVVVHDDFLWLCQRENSSNQEPGLSAISNSLYAGNQNYDWIFIGDTRPRFYAKRTKTGQTVNGGVDTKILLDTGTGNANSQDATNNGIKPYFRSLQQIIAEVHIESGLTAGTGYLQIVVYRVRSGVTTGALLEQWAIDATSFHHRAIGVVDAFAGDLYYMHVYHTNGTNPSLSTVNASGLTLVGLPSYSI